MSTCAKSIHRNIAKCIHITPACMHGCSHMTILIIANGVCIIIWLLASYYIATYSFQEKDGEIKSKIDLAIYDSKIFCFVTQHNYIEGI